EFNRSFKLLMLHDKPVRPDQESRQVSDDDNYRMNTYIALFRGINVGGKNSLPMKDLVSLLEALGSRNVTTYIQSGNAVFQHGEDDVSLLKNRIGAEVKQRCGF